MNKNFFSGGGPHRKSLDMGIDEGTYKFRGDKDGKGPPPVMAWAPNMGPIEPSDTDSIEGSSVEASPPTRYKKENISMPIE